MPQLDPEFFVSQLFWLVVTFSFLFFFLWKVSLPRISSVLEKRENKINNDIKTAKQLQTEAEQIQNKINLQLHDAKNQSSNIVKESTLNLQNKITSELIKIDSELSKKIDESSAIMEKNKQNSIKELNDQIFEITKLTLSKLSSMSVNNQEIKDSITKTQSSLIN